MRPDHPYSITIDGFSITYNESDSHVVTSICQNLFDLMNDPQFKNSTVTAGHRYRHRFKMRLPIDHVKPTGFILIEVGARSAGIANLRLDFKPAKTGPSGLQDAISILDLITPYGGHHFIKHGTFTRYDIAIDLWNYTVDEVMAFGKGSQKHGVYTNREGRPETVYMGSQRSNRSVAYTKIHKSTGRQSLRLERRLKRRYRGYELPLMPDPFRAVRLIHTETILPHLDGLIPQLFFDSARLRGLSRVLSFLSPAGRKAIKQLLKDPTKSMLPSTGEIWIGWPQLLEDSGLGFLLPQSGDAVSLAPVQQTSMDESAEAL